MDLIVATYNAHKYSELVPLFPGLRLLTPQAAGLGSHDIPEEGNSYAENALAKAQYIFSLSGRPSLADDSGLSVDALGGEPGIRSARYGSGPGEEPLPSWRRNELLLQAMRDRPDRTCAFICALALVYARDRFLLVQETCPGFLLDSPRGSGGFGYDPLVFLPDFQKSMAELSPEEKNLVSHRGRAARRMAAILSALGEESFQSV